MNGLMTPTQDGERRRMVCPACNRFLCVVEATYVECPPCSCGFQTTVRAVGRRARAGLADRLEVKQA